MAATKKTKEEKQAALNKYRDLVLATLDYYLEFKELLVKTAGFDTAAHFRQLKTQAEEHFQRGRLTKLKQWFRDLSETFHEEGDIKFNKYLQEKTGHTVDIRKSYLQRVDKVIKKGQITTDNQFYEIKEMVDQLCQAGPVDSEKIEMLNKLLREYEQRKSQQAKKPG